MIEELIFRISLTVLVVAIILVELIMTRRLNEKRGSWYQPVHSVFLPVLILAASLILLILPSAALPMLSWFFGALLSLFALTLLLLALIPLLRKRYSARDCAEFWLLPGLLMGVSVYFFRMPFRPWLTVRLSRTALTVLFAVWIAGFLAVLGWKVLSHLRFRNAVLRGAVLASEEDHALFREVWKPLDRENRKTGQKLRIVRSPAAVSPLSVGLFPRTTCLVLPQREYAEEELRLIFRHESLHLLHRDNAAKFSIAFLCAAGWFIPSLWLGLRRASEDLELRCDEEATTGMDEAKRRAYAALLLENAGTAEGFTTCLSASASGLRYRLGRVLRPENRNGGLAVIALLSALFVFSLGTVGAVIDVGTVQTEVLDRNGKGWQVVEAEFHSAREDLSLNPGAVEARLGELGLTKLSWEAANYHFVSGSLDVKLQTSYGSTMDLYFWIDSNGLRMNVRNGEGVKAKQTSYVVNAPADLEWLRSLGN